MKKYSVLILFLLASCAHQQLWIKSGATTKEFYQAKGRCLVQASQVTGIPAQAARDGVFGPGPHTRAFSECMMGEGWALQD